MTPREYQKQIDFCRLWDLMQQQLSSAKIARQMGKDPAWVCRSIKKIEEDFATTFPRPTEAETILSNLMLLESLLKEALRVVGASEGNSKMMALRIASSLLHQKSEYEIRIGRVAPRTKCDLGYNMDPIEDLLAKVAAGKFN